MAQFFRLSSLLVLTLLLACSGKKNNGRFVRQDDFSSPKNLFVDHVSSFTGGVVSIGSTISLRLAKPAGDSLAGTSPSSDIFDFSPAIEGSAIWQDNRTLVFQPSGWLKSGQRYEVTANIGKLIPDLEKDKRSFKFVFQTLVQNYEIRTDGIHIADKNKPGMVRLEGTFQTADIAQPEAIQKALTATQNNKPLAIQWEYSGADNLYAFTIDQVARTEKEGEVLLYVAGLPLGMSRDANITVPIPSLSDYKVISSRIVRGKENYISVLFSDPLDDRQNLNGLVSLKGVSANPRLVIHLNELKIYPTQKIENNTRLELNKAIKNMAGHPLKSDYTTELQFTQSKPEVKLANGNEKAILPSSKGLVLPFDAVGLQAVDVTVIRIFEDNMLQYLQVNGMGGTSQLQRVGRPIASRTIPLNASGVTNLNNWNRFTLNLEDIISTEPGAMYQIRIGFKKQHSLYFCADNQNIEEIDTESDEWGTQEEESYWDDYEYYYDSDYDWRERDNPCSNSYYGSNRTVSKVLFASDLGIIAKRRDDGPLHVFVSNLITTRPESGTTIEIYDYQQQQIGTGTTDGEGRLQISSNGEPFVLVARKGSQIGYLKLDDGSALSLSNFDITGNRVQKGLKGFIYGERGVWRPADTLHLAFILEDASQSLPEQHPVIMELYNPSGQLHSRKVSAQPVGTIYRFDMLTEPDAPTGNWQAKVKAGGATFEKTIKIETIKPNRLKIDLDFGTDKLTASSSQIAGNLNVRWLSGAKASQLKAEFDLVLSPARTTFKDFPNFSFDDQSKDFYSSREQVYEGKLDKDGTARVSINLGDADNAPGALTARFLGKVYEEGGDFSVKNITIPYYPYTSFVGVKAPEGDKRGILLTDEDHLVRIATVDADGTPISRRNLKVELYKLDWKWWWDNSYDYISNYVGRSYREPIKTGTINTSNGEGTWKLKVEYPEWGRYYIRVEDPVSGHSTGQVIYMDWPGWAGKAQRGELDGATMLDFGIEKEEYKVGEKIALSIPSTPGNRILVSLESGSEVLQTFWVEAEKENTAISFEATSEMSPNVYAHLTMVQPHGQSSNDLPIRLYGVQSIKVVDPSTELKPVIGMPKELQPEQRYTIEISEANKKAMAYTLAVVDEGLLDITNFETPSPWSAFFAREALGIKTWDVYDDVMGAFSGKMEPLLAIGGDGEIGEKEEKEANRFKPVVHYLGPFYLSAGKTAKHILTMPQYIGSVKTMVVAAGNGAYGKADQQTPVKQPLMVMATLPRVAGPGESMKLPVNVFVLDKKIKNISLKVESKGTLVLQGSPTMTLTFNGEGDQVAYFDLKAKEALGMGKVTVTATSGQLSATYDVEMNVIPRNPQVTKLQDKIIAEGSQWETRYQPTGILGKNKAFVEFSSLPPLNIEQRLGYLIQYPHGCIEQTTSAVFAQLFINKLMKLDSDRESEIQQNVAAAIKRLKSFQLPSGGFSYWPGNDYPNLWGTNYAGHFLIEAKASGYDVPESLLSSWIGFQTQKAESWNVQNSDQDNDLTQAYRLYTLAKVGNPALGAMNRMKERPNLKREASWRLALAYAIAGYDTQARELIEGLVTEPDAANIHYRSTFGSQTRDQAMILETLLTLDQKEKAFGILMKIAGEMGEKDRWMSTQTTAYCFIAIAKYTDKFKVDEETNIALDFGGKTSSLKGNDFVYQASLPDPDKPVSIKISNKGNAPVFARLIQTGIPIEGTGQSEAENIRFEISYYDKDGSSLDISRLPQGTNFTAKVTVSNPGLKGPYTELALTQIFPSGWEIINTRLDGSDQVIEASAAKYMDIRDDRVMHYFDLAPNKQASFTVMLNAAYQGSYFLPTVSVEAMYDNTIYARKAGKWVQVVAE